MDTGSHSDSERLQGSLISVKEAENSFDYTECGGTSTKHPTTSDGNSTTQETSVSDCSRNGFSQDGDAKSDSISESQKKSKIKANSISPVNEEVSEIGRTTPESLSSKGMDGVMIFKAQVQFKIKIMVSLLLFAVIVSDILYVV